jgi:hypothetical protein
MKTIRLFRHILPCDITAPVIYILILAAAVSGCSDSQSDKGAGSNKMSGTNPQFSSIETQKGDIICDSTNYMNVALCSEEKTYHIQIIENEPVLVEVQTTACVTVEIVDSSSNRLIYCDRAYAIVVDGGDGSLSLVPVQGS